MKQRILLTIVAVLCCVATVFAQSDRISYQAVVRDADNHLVVNKVLTVNVTVSDGTTVYTETHTVTSNVNGLISLQLGGGTNASGNWNAMKWNQASVTTAISAGGSSIGTVSMPLTAVPYAMYAKYADNVNPAAISQQIHDSVMVVRDGLDEVAVNLAELAEKERADSAELKGLIDANANGIANLNTNLTNNYYNKDKINDTITNILGQITTTVGELGNNYYTKTEVDTKDGALAARIVADSTELKGLIDANASDISDLQSADNALAARIVTDSTELKGLIDANANGIANLNTNLTNNYYNKDKINDTITNILGQITTTAGELGNNYYTKTEVDTKDGALAARIVTDSNNLVNFKAKVHQDSLALGTMIDANAAGIAENKQAIIDSSDHIRGEVSTFKSGLEAGIAENKQAIIDSSDHIRGEVSTIKSGLETGIAENKQAIIDSSDHIRGEVSTIKGGLEAGIAENKQAIIDSSDHIRGEVSTIKSGLEAGIAENKQAIIDSSAHIRTEVDTAKTNIRTEISTLNTNVAATYATKTALQDDSLLLAQRLDALEAVQEHSNKYNATAGQTSFTLSQAPASTRLVRIYINGVMVGDNDNTDTNFPAVISVSGTTVTYQPANNGNYALRAGDRVVIYYFK